MNCDLFNMFSSYRDYPVDVIEQWAHRGIETVAFLSQEYKQATDMGFERVIATAAQQKAAEVGLTTVVNWTYAKEDYDAVFFNTNDIFALLLNFRQNFKDAFLILILYCNRCEFKIFTMSLVF